MSGIAEVLVNLGFRVSGSDLKRSATTDRLQKMGVEFFEGHSADNVGQPHVVVRSTAVRDDNRDSPGGAPFDPVIARAEMLAELMRLKPTLSLSQARMERRPRLRWLQPSWATLDSIRRWSSAVVVGAFGSTRISAPAT